MDIHLCRTGDLLGVSPLRPQPRSGLSGIHMANKETKTEVKRLRLTALENKQLEAYLAQHGLGFTEFANKLISEKIMSDSPTVIAENRSIDMTSKKQEKKVITKVVQTDPAILFQVGRIGNNINQIAKALNQIQYDKNAMAEFSYLECLHTLDLIQTDLKTVLGELPKIKRSEKAVQRARERALKAVESRLPQDASVEYVEE